MTNIDSMLLPDLKKVASSLGVKSAGLRKLLEAKDCFVRAKIS